MVDHEPITGHDSNVTPIGTSLQAYHALLDLVPNRDRDIHQPALRGIEDTCFRPGSDTEPTEAYLAEAAVMARTAFADTLKYGRDSQEYLRNRRYVLDAMGALWKFQEGQSARDMFDTIMTTETEAVILPFRRPNS